jgi:hypothetical protein
MMSLPMIAQKYGYSLDGLRAFVRKRPELRALGTMIGPSRVYAEAEVKRIREAWESRQAATAAKAG